MISPMARDQSSRPFLTICSIWDRWRIPISRNVRSSYCAKAATAFLTSRSRRHFAHRLAVARQIMASQPGWTNRYRSTSCAAASLVDGIPDPKAIRSTASSLSSTAISARATDETSEMDFRRLRQESSGGRRASTSLVIAVTALVANPCSEAP